MGWVVLVRSIFDNDVDVFVAEGVTSRKEADEKQAALAAANAYCTIEVVQLGSNRALEDLLFSAVDED